MAGKKFGAYLQLSLSAAKLIVDTALWIGLCTLIVLFSLQFPHSPKVDSLWLIEKIHLWADPVLGQIVGKIGKAWPTEGVSLLPIGAGFAILAVKLGFDTVMQWAMRFARKRFPLPEETLALSASASSQGISVSSTLLALAAVSDKAMEKVRRKYTRIESRLAATKPRWCAFLSIGVVDAEAMKEGEDPEKVARSFGLYERMLEEIFRLTGAWKEAWTTDGVMVCYLDIYLALDGAQRALKGLEDFNRGQNALSKPFRICCGLNEGDVTIFEDSKLQKVADRVIDVAGHMQKKARPNSLWLSSEVYDRLEKKAGFYPAMAQVDGYTVLEWRSDSLPEQQVA